MAGDWIPWSKGLTRKPEVIAVAKATRRNRREVAGLLMEFWEWIDEQAQGGAVGNTTLADLSDMIPSTDEGFWQAVIQVGWLATTETGISIPNAERWLGNSAKKRLEETRRKRIYRMSQNSRDKNGTRGEERIEERGMNSPKTPSCPEPLFAASGPTPSPSVDNPGEEILRFPVVGRGVSEWALHEGKLREYREAFPGLDVLAESRKALQWCRDNPAKRKTPRGMPAFLWRWFERAQNSGRGKGSPAIRETPKEKADRILKEREDRAKEVPAVVTGLAEKLRQATAKGLARKEPT